MTIDFFTMYLDMLDSRREADRLKYNERNMEIDERLRSIDETISALEAAQRRSQMSVVSRRPGLKY